MIYFKGKLTHIYKRGARSPRLKKFNFMLQIAGYSLIFFDIFWVGGRFHKYTASILCELDVWVIEQLSMYLGTDQGLILQSIKQNQGNYAAARIASQNTPICKLGAHRAHAAINIIERERENTATGIIALFFGHKSK
jgi:hypothetical protein